jgi:hypothetical protein
MSKKIKYKIFLRLNLTAGHELVTFAFYRVTEVWIKSHYIQYIASGDSLSFERYLQQSLSETFIARINDYAASLANWEECSLSVGSSVYIEDIMFTKKIYCKNIVKLSTWFL